MKKIEFSKYQGTGNDFILIDNREKIYTLTVSEIKALCKRRFGIGADGLMLLESKQGVDFEMIYYNADGNESTMCGNGGRSIVAFAYSIGVVGLKGQFLAIDGIHEFEILEGEKEKRIALKMIDVPSYENKEKYFFINTGSPHHIEMVEDAFGINVFEKGRAIRNSEKYITEGVNVNFVEATENGLIVRTYERGVEDETFSCGTGVTAAAICSTHSKGTGNYNKKVFTKGGELEVKFKRVETGIEDVWLIGPAKLVYKGQLFL